MIRTTKLKKSSTHRKLVKICTIKIVDLFSLSTHGTTKRLCSSPQSMSQEITKNQFKYEHILQTQEN